MMDAYLQAEFVALYRSFETDGNKLLGIIRKITNEKTCFKSTETGRIWRLTEFGIPRYSTAFAELNVWLEDIEQIKKVKWYHIRKWDEAHRHLPLYVLIKLLEDGILVPVKDPEKSKSSTLI